MEQLNEVVSRLLASGEASTCYKMLVHVLGQDPGSAEARRLQEEIKNSARVQALLSERDEDGTIPYHPYAKWYGAHWVLASLADIGYPAGDESLVPLREQVFEWLFGQDHQESIRTISIPFQR